MAPLTVGISRVDRNTGPGGVTAVGICIGYKRIVGGARLHSISVSAHLFGVGTLTCDLAHLPWCAIAAALTH